VRDDLDTVKKHLSNKVGDHWLWGLFGVFAALLTKWGITPELGYVLPVLTGEIAGM
jgi:hypothetical protein